ncbi:hypothetical protein T08_11516 [Trichinella sp. T8]|nr:hypothetical protein T08_11516 [Trichinella sp. T8]
MQIYNAIYIFKIIVVPINGLKLNIISMLTFLEICYYAISDMKRISNLGITLDCLNVFLANICFV